MGDEDDRKCCDYENCPAYKYCWDHSKNKFPPIRLTFLISSSLFYIVDVALDAYVAYEHYVARGTDPQAIHYFEATLFFIIAPLVVINIISWALYTWGWLVYVNTRLRNYCNGQSQAIVYIEYSEGPAGEREPSRVVPVCEVDGKKEIMWPWYRKSRGRKSRERVSPTNMESCEAVETTFTSGENNVEEIDLEDQDTPTDTVKREGFEEVDFGSPPVSPSSSDEVDTHLEFYALDFIDTCEYIGITILHIFMLGFVFRVIRLIYKRKQDQFSFDRYRDLSFLRLMEAFLESAPQVVLQLYIVIIRQEARLLYKVVTPISITVSMISLALAVADYISAGKDLSFYDPPPNTSRKPRLTWTAYFLVIFWHLFMIASRSFAFALFATIYGRYVFVIVGLHYAAMVYWMYYQHANVFIRSYGDYFDPRRHICGNYGVEFIVAAFNTFFHFKLKEGKGVETLIPFYTLTFVENTLMILLWFFARDPTVGIWYRYPALVSVFGLFIAGLVILLCYYYFFQPSKQPNLSPDPDLDHPTMTCTLNRMYRLKKIRGNFFQRCMRRSHDDRRSSASSTLRLIGQN